MKSAPRLKQLFALEGLALLYPSAGVFTQQACFGLLWKSEQYESVGPSYRAPARCV